MATILASGSTGLIAFGCMATVALGVWWNQKRNEAKAEKRSEELRNLYASVHSESRRKAS